MSCYSISYASHQAGSSCAVKSSVTRPEGNIVLLEESSALSSHPGLLVGVHSNLFADCITVCTDDYVGEYCGGVCLQVLVHEDAPVGPFEAILQLHRGSFRLHLYNLYDSLSFSLGGGMLE